MLRVRTPWLAAALLAAAAVPLLAQAPGYSGHGADSVSREVLARYAPPPLDAEVSRRIQLALDLRSAGVGQLTPDGRRLVFGWAITGTPQVWRLDGPGAFPVQLTGGEDRTGLAAITPDGKTLVLSRDRGGQEDPGIYLQSIEGGPLTVVQHLPKVQSRLAFVSRDSRFLYFTANDREPASYAVYRFEIATGARELLVGEPGLWWVADHREEADGLHLLLAKATGALSREIWEWSAATRALEPLLGVGESEEYDVAYGAAPGELLVRTNRLGEFRRLFRWRRGGELVPVTDEGKRDVAGFGLDEARARLYVQYNDGGYLRLEARDAQSFAVLPLPELPGAESVMGGSATPDGRFLILGVGTARAPSTSWVWDWQTGALTQWTLPTVPEVDLGRFAAPRLESYPARDGTAVPYFVRYPEGCEPERRQGDPCPIVVEFHGGPEGQAMPGFSPRAQLFVDAGFVFVQPNVRGSDGYGRSWLAADDGPKRLDVLTDIEDCARHLRRRFARDGKEPKLGVTGGSYGGYSTLVAMTLFAGAYDAGASIVGMSDLRSFLANTAPYRRRLRASEYGDPERDAEALARLSPVTYLDRVKGPLLLIQGVDDPRVPVGEAVQIQEKLAARGLDSRLILLEGEGHGAARRASQAIQLGHQLRFFEETLGGR